LSAKLPDPYICGVLFFILASIVSLEGASITFLIRKFILVIITYWLGFYVGHKIFSKKLY